MIQHQSWRVTILMIGNTSKLNLDLNPYENYLQSIGQTSGDFQV